MQTTFKENSYCWLNFIFKLSGIFVKILVTMHDTDTTESLAIKLMLTDLIPLKQTLILVAPPTF